MVVGDIDYLNLIFDCDGVVLDSNKVKIQAFYQADLPYGEEAAQALVDYHVSHGGISRYKKFALFLEEIVPAYAAGCIGPNLEALLDSYAMQVKQGLLTCEVAPGLQDLREKTKDAKWLIVSGVDQEELREVFAQRGLAELFDSGIFGSPDTKDAILARELASGNIQQPALFLGDSKYDYQAAQQAGLDFVFLSGWSEIKDWPEWSAHYQLSVAENLQNLMEV